MLIRKMETRDIPRACILVQELTGKEMSEDDMRDRLEFVENSPINELFVCEVDGAVRGLIGFRIRENVEEVSRFGEVSVLVVDSGFRGKGIGRAMMEFAEGHAKEKGCTGTWLVSELHREGAHRFYKGLGYVINGYRFIRPFPSKHTTASNGT